MKKFLCSVLSIVILSMQTGIALAIQEAPAAAQKQAAIAYKKDARTITYAFVFDGPSDKNQEVLKTFQSTITKSLLPVKTSI